MEEKGFSLVELVVVVMIIGILASLALLDYDRFKEQQYGRVATATLQAIATGITICKVHAGDLEGIYDATEDYDGDGKIWNPNEGADSNWCWEEIKVSNPNKDSEPFIYDFWDATYSKSWAAGHFNNEPRIVALRKGQADNDRFIIMNFDTGEIYKTEPY